MKLTAQIWLLPSPEQATALRSTLERGNEACNLVSQYAFEQNVFPSKELQKVHYYHLKETFGLSAQLVIRCLSKVSDSYKTLKAQIRNHNAICEQDKKRSLTQIVYRPTGAIAFDSRILSYRTDRKTVSIWTVGGRQTISYAVSEHHARLLEHQQGESDLALVKGKWYLLATCDIPDASADEFDDVLGIDLGIIQIASDSDGQSFSGADIEQSRQWYAKRRSLLQSVGSKSAKRKLKQLSKGESRFKKDTNHCISKQLVTKAKCTHRAIALENLEGIRTGTKVRKPQRSKHSSWSFLELRTFIEYKATMRGVTILLVDPRNTSRTCSVCSHCERANRKSQADFVCKSCGHSANADFNASQNIKSVGRIQTAYGVGTTLSGTSSRAFAGGI